MLTAVQRGESTRNTQLPGMKAKQLKLLLAQIAATDSIVVSNGHKPHAECAREQELQHETIVVSRDGYVRGIWHLQNVNTRHERMKNLVSQHCRGVIYQVARSYLSWFHRYVTSASSKSSCVFGSDFVIDSTYFTKRAYRIDDSDRVRSNFSENQLFRKGTNSFNKGIFLLNTNIHNIAFKTAFRKHISDRQPNGHHSLQQPDLFCQG